MNTLKQEPYNLTREEFADWCFPVGHQPHRDKVHAFFIGIGWREGFVYCSQSINYARTIGYDCIHKEEP